MTFEGIKQNLMAVESFDMVSKKIIYDNEIYDANKKTWVRKDSKFNAEPSYIEIHETALKDLIVNKDDITGLITISFEIISSFCSRVCCLGYKRVKQHYQRN